jgi:hypothetical protein
MKILNTDIQKFLVPMLRAGMRLRSGVRHFIKNGARRNLATGLKPVLLCYRMRITGLKPVLLC